MHEQSGHELRLEPGPDAARAARRFTSQALEGLPEDTVDSAQLVVTELVTNALLHGAPPVVLRLHRRDEGARIEVHDAGARPPVRLLDAGEGMTGRGLSLVSALSARWGTTQQDVGKVVWAEVPGEGTTKPVQDGDVDALLSGWEDDLDAEPMFSVALGDVPTDLLIAAKAHVDNLARELALATSASEEPGPQWTRDLLRSVVEDFAGPRTQIKEQAVSSARRGDLTTHLVLRLPASAADDAERYLAALDAADRHAREARLLTLEAPAVHKVFRRWYLEELAGQLRAQVGGRTAPRPTTFLQRLAQEVTWLAPLRETAARLWMVQRVTADLAGAGTVEEVAEAVSRNAHDILQARVAAIYLHEDGWFQQISRRGEGDDALNAQYTRYPADADTPSGDVLRSGEMLVLRSAHELVERYPHLKGEHPDDARFLIAPLQVGDNRFGVLFLQFLGTEAVDEESQLSMLATLAGVTAQALDRAMATQRASQAAEKLAVLAEASVVLASTLDPRRALQALAEELVPRLADLCVIHLVQDGRLVSMAMAHYDPEFVAWARTQPERNPAERDLPVGAPQVLRTGESELYQDITDELLQLSADDQEQLEMLRSMGFSSALVVPLKGRTGVIGAMSLIYSASQRHYDADDLQLAEDLARRTAVAVETAQAFREQSTRLADVTRVAEAAQHAILAEPPGQVGRVALSARYLSAAAEALVGGDLYETVPRPGGVRLLIGDVRGKGLEAVRLATIVLGEFRAAAADLDDLCEVARQIDRRVRSYQEAEDFVTAVVADVNDDGTLTLVNLGHPRPLLAARDGTVREVVSPPSLPLGLGVDPHLVTDQLHEGERLLLFTDGVIEARQPSGAFVDLEAVVAALPTSPFDEVLDDILGAVRTATGGPLSDDLALLVAEYRPAD